MTQPTAPLLEVDGLRKEYPSFTLDDVSFRIGPGAIVGFIGRNGAGKSTTLKCLEGAVHPDGGSVRYFGMDFAGNQPTIKRRVAYELGGASFYPQKRLDTIARSVSTFYPGWDGEAYRDWCARFSLDGSKRVRELSDGMRVKFALALALSRQSDLLILDEPTSGLGPASRDEVLDVFLDVVADGRRSILFSTHIASDSDKCASRILFLRQGRLIADDTLKAFENAYRLVAPEEISKTGIVALGTRRVGPETLALVSASSVEGVSGIVSTVPTLDDIMSFDPEAYEADQRGM